MATNQERLGEATAKLMDTLDEQYPGARIEHAFVLVTLDTGDGTGTMLTQATDIPRHAAVGMLETAKHHLLS